MAMHSRLQKTPPALSNSSSPIINPDPCLVQDQHQEFQQIVSQIKTADSSNDRQNMTKFTKSDSKKNPSRM